MARITAELIFFNFFNAIALVVCIDSRFLLDQCQYTISLLSAKSPFLDVINPEQLKLVSDHMR